MSYASFGGKEKIADVSFLFNFMNGSIDVAELLNKIGLRVPSALLLTQYVTGAVSTACVIGGVYYAYYHYTGTHNKIPDKWVQVGYLKRLYLYPIKSCAPIILNQLEPHVLGMKDGWLFDRSLMIVDAKDNNFITARGYPELFKVQPSCHRAILTLEYPNIEPIQVNLAEVMVTQRPIKATVWKAPVSVYDCGEEANKWFTKILDRPGMNFRLVYYASQKPRPLIGNPKIFNKVKKEDAGIFPDETSFNFINEASIDDLNTRLAGRAVSERYFRPNILLSGPTAFDEDNWRYLKIGDNIFEVVKPCTRCLVTIINPETGTRDSNMEPLTTLRSYRLHKDPEVRKATGASPCMGIQLALRQRGGLVSLNDPFYVAY